MVTPIRNYLLTLSIAAIGGWGLAADCFACRYSVRDVAFVAFPDEFYRLYVYVESDVESWRAAIAEANESRFVESNIRARLVEVHAESEDSALQYAQDLGASNLPSAVLVNREGGGLPIPLEGSSPAESLEALYRWVSDSPQRGAIVHTLLTSHSVVLLVEGVNAEQNRVARSWAEETIQLVNQSLAFLPKPVKQGPELVVISADEQQAEAVLLWSLGLTPRLPEETHLIVLMGRGRRVGPGVTLPGAERVELERSLAAVGQDCECGLDRRWMQGEMIPHVWSEQFERQAVAELGFDPGSPSVATEISRILARSDSTRGMADVDLSLSPLGLQIIELSPLDTSAEDFVEPSQEPAATESASLIERSNAVTEVPDEDASQLPPAQEIGENQTPAADNIPSNDGTLASTSREYGMFRPVVLTALGLICLAMLGGIWILMRPGSNT